MSHRTASHSSQARQTSFQPSASAQSTALQTRINEKRAELESLKQLRDLSGGLAGQMEQLEQKLATLSDGTEAIAAVLSNWHNVLKAISLASAHMAKPPTDSTPTETVSLPQTLVRIPMQHIKPAPEGADDIPGSFPG